ncbi:MAG: protein kinase [Cyanobacteria bacterium]|nr:protein kinase [Cyanobacteriota bacterium]
MAEKVSILIAEDQDLARLGLKTLLGKVEGVEVVGEAVDGEEIVDLAEKYAPGIILMDIGLPKIDGIEATQKIKAVHPTTRIIMFTSDESDDTVLAALRAGADGYCVKTRDLDQLSKAINSVLEGNAWMDPAVASRLLKAQVSSRGTSPQAEVTTNNKEEDNGASGNMNVQILTLLGQGLSKDQIAERLTIPVSLVETTVRQILSGGLSGDSTVDTRSQDDSSRMRSTRELTPGTKFASDKYLIKGILGEGGMSVVYDAHHDYSERRVAIKVLKDNLVDNEDSMARFKREAKAMCAIVHPNLVTVYDSGLTDYGQPYIVMDFLEGMSLEQYLDDATCQPHPMELVSIFCQVCEALDAAHKKDLVHRDLKPSNIMLIEDAEGNAVVKLVDFGIAKFMGDNPEKRLTQAGEVFGTPPFMSPEQCKGEDLDSRSDIYSLGCVMYEAFTGERAFDAPSLYQVLTMQVTETPSRHPFKTSKSNLMKELEKIVFHCLEKQPSKRPTTAIHVKQALIAAYKATRGK